jgi:hypothetical protein
MPPYSNLNMEAVGFSETLVSTRLHNITYQNRVTFTITALRTSDLSNLICAWLYMASEFVWH